VTEEERQRKITVLRMRYEGWVNARAYAQKAIEDVRDELEELGVLP
jgi:hypothetical protein